MRATKNEIEASGLINQIFEKQEHHLLLIVVLSSIVLFSTLHLGDLSGYDDAFYAYEGKQMLLSGDWWNVRFNGNLNFEYPPMFIWMEALSMRVFGISDFAAKFPSALSGLLIIVLVYSITRRLTADFWLPIIAAWVMMFTPYFLKYSMHAMTDVPFALFFTLAIYFYVRGLEHNIFLTLCGIPIGLAILTRSLLGMIVIGIIVAHLIITRRYRLLWSAYFLSGLLLALLLPAMWFYSQYRLYGDEFLSTHLSFVSGKMLPPEPPDVWKIIRSFVHYPRMLFKLYLPWLPLMLMGLFMQAREMVRYRDKLATLLVVWVVLVVCAFSLAEAKILRYIMPAFPAFSILSAIPINKWLSTRQRKIDIKIVYAFLATAALLIAAFAVPKIRAEDMHRLAPIADAHGDPDQRVFLYTSGEPHSNYVTQLLWYSNRFCEHLSNLDEMLVKLRSDEPRVVIMDKTTYASLVANPKEPVIQLKRGWELRIEKLGETENFMCLRGFGVKRKK